MIIYTIHDSVAEFFLPIFTAENDNVAKRIFIASLGSNFPHRADYTLYRIGQFCPDEGNVAAENAQLLMSGLSIAESLDPRPRPITNGESDQ